MKKESDIEFSIVVPARNEEKYLPRCLGSIEVAAKFANASFETIVVLNRCTDNTEEIATGSAATIARCDEKNLSLIRNSGAAIARGRILITIDADSRMSPNMLFEVRKQLLEKNAIGGAVSVWPERHSLGIWLTALCLLPLILRDGISGGMFYCLKSTFDEINGFDPSLVSAEDVDFARRLKAYGKSQGQSFSIILKAHIVTSCRKFDTLGDWYFLKNPSEFWRIFKGKDTDIANKFWYDFPRRN